MKTMSNGNHESRWPVSRQMMLVALVVAVLLSVPMVAMQFTAEVNWDRADFAVAAILLGGTGTAYVLGSRVLRKGQYRIILAGVLGLLLALTWVELAVGLFGSPFAGS